jgi:AraC family transcriptional regulator of adaptative response / DNA-3-methyladenine glycosylase II
VRLRLCPAHTPYDAGRLLWFLGLHAVPGLETWDGTTYARVLRLPGGPGVVRIALLEPGYAAELELSRPEDEAVARAQLDHLLALDADPTEAIDQLAVDPLLGPLVMARPGLRTPGSVDHVETLLRTVVGQQVSLAGARTVTGRVVAAQGDPLPEGLRTGALTHAFPTAEVLARIDPESLPMPRARGRAVVAVANAVRSGGEGVADGQPEHAAALLALPGIGPWTVAYLALRAARDPDVFLPTDLAVRRALESHGLPGDPRSALERSLDWSPFRSVALMHLWTQLLEGRG